MQYKDDLPIVIEDQSFEHVDDDLDTYDNDNNDAKQEDVGLAEEEVLDVK